MDGEGGRQVMIHAVNNVGPDGMSMCGVKVVDIIRFGLSQGGPREAVRFRCYPIPCKGCLGNVIDCPECAKECEQRERG